MTDLALLPAREIAARVRRRELRARDVLDAHLARLRALEPRLHAFLHVSETAARETADRIDREGHDGPLAGVPVALKDNLATRDAPTTCASRILEGYVAPYDATVVERLRAADAVLLGKTNLDEFAMGSSTENSAFGPTKNPWDLARVPGGSSGGSAAAVAAGLAPLALGSDTGGSIRQPAALTGTVGFKPTYGRVSRYGLVAFASSLDQIGPFARDVADCALLFRTIGGPDPRDSTSAPVPLPDLDAEIAQGARGLRFAIPREFLEDGVDPEVRAALDRSAAALRDAGAEVVEDSLPTLQYGIATYYLVATSEASSNLARYDGVHYGLRVPGEDIVRLVSRSRAKGFGAEVQRRILLGTFALSSGYYDAYYVKALKARRVIQEDLLRVLAKADLILGPTTPTPAFRLGEKTSDPLAMYLSDIYTVTANLAGVPAISIPAGRTASGLPIGVQFHGRPFDDAKVLRAAAALERALGVAPMRAEP